MMPLTWRRPLLALLLLPLALLNTAPIAASAAPAAAMTTAAKTLVAVAANFKTTAELLAARFEAASGHEVVIISGATGKLYTQIRNGAPFDLFLAADTERPQLLTSSGDSPAAPRTYASGRLGIWVRGEHPNRADPAESLNGLRRLAIANPSLAPYGVAAMAVLDQLALREQIAARLAYGENVAQAYALVAAGAADGGLIAWSLLMEGGRASESWPVPTAWHPPIDQDAVLLTHGAENPAAIAFFDFLFSPAARELIRERGYVVPES
jgi:molybdate transport system substrate-binding protein